MKYTITRNSSRGISQLTTRSLESDRDVCAARANGDQQLVTLFTHMEQSRTFACASIAPVGLFRIASKGPKRADHAAGTDFTRPRHGSCQLSLIEILKCHASLAAAATETILGKFCRRQTENKDQAGSSLIVGILSRTIINVILCASYNSFFSTRYLKLHNHKLALSFSIFVYITQSRKCSQLLECVLLAKRDRLISFLCITIYIHIDIIKRDFFFDVTAAESTEYIDGTSE